MMNKNNCWCGSWFHFPGEKRAHLKAQADAREVVKLPSFVGMLESGDADLASKAKRIVRGSDGRSSNR